MRESAILVLFTSVFLFSISVIMFLDFGLSENNVFTVFQNFLLGQKGIYEFGVTSSKNEGS